MARQLQQDEQGASAVEYSLIAVAIAAVVVAIVFALGSIVQEQYSDSCTVIRGQMSTSTSC